MKSGPYAFNAIALFSVQAGRDCWIEELDSSSGWPLAYRMQEWTDETAQWYAAKYGEYATNRMATDLLDLKPASVLVDIGCGTAAALRHAAGSVSIGQLIGIDPVARMIAIARERVAAVNLKDRIQLIQGDAREIPLPSDLADYVLAYDSMEYWQEPLQCLREIGRILKPEGRLIVVKDLGTPAASKFEQFLLRLLEAVGFQVLETRRIKEAKISFMMWWCAAAQG